MNSYYVWPQLRYVGLNISLKLPRPLEDNLNLLPGPLAPTPASASLSTHRESPVYFNWNLPPCLSSTFFPDKNLLDVPPRLVQAALGVSEPYRKSSSGFPAARMLVVMKSGIWLAGWQNIIRAHKYVGGGGRGRGGVVIPRGGNYWDIFPLVVVILIDPVTLPHSPHTHSSEKMPLLQSEKQGKNISIENVWSNVC